MIEQSPLRLVGCTREDCAGFAADAYARVNGIGAVCVTYCVGGLSLCNSIAGAYAEKSPVVVISGAPGLRERANNPLLHHRVKDFQTQADVFRRLCGAEAATERSRHAPSGGSTACWRRWRATSGRATSSCRGTWSTSCPKAPTPPRLAARPATRRSWPRPWPRPRGGSPRPARPVIIADVEIHRFGLQDRLLALAEGAGIPMVSTILGKSVVSERHPLFAGIYEGAMGREEVTRFVESERLRDPAGRLHDRHQPGHLHGQPRRRRGASTPPARRCGSAATITTACCWPTSSTG